MATGKIEKVITQEKLHYYNIVNICPHWDGTNMFIDFFITEEALCEIDEANEERIAAIEDALCELDKEEE